MGFRFKKLNVTPRQARIYLFFALLLIALPTFMYKLYPSHAGKFVVASDTIVDPNFSKTLVYMTRHHGYGAVGYILNKPLAAERIAGIRARFPFAGDSQFYFGGPVGEGAEFFFVVPSDLQWSAIEILDVKTLQNKDPERYNTLIKDDFTAKNMRILSGYAGWSSLQLNREILRGGWDILPYDGALLAGLSQEESWLSAIERIVAEKKVITPVI